MMEDTTYQFKLKKGEYRDCRKCWYETREDIFVCPRCSTELHSESKIRNAGSVDVALGGLLTIMMTGVFFGLLLLFIFGKNSGNAQTRENFSRFEVNFVFMGIFMVVLALLSFGVTMFFAGRHAIKHGRRDRRKIKLALTMLFAGLFIMGILMALIG